MEPAHTYTSARPGNRPRNGSPSRTKSLATESPTCPLNLTTARRNLCARYRLPLYVLPVPFFQTPRLIASHKQPIYHPEPPGTNLPPRPRQAKHTSLWITSAIIVLRPVINLPHASDVMNITTPIPFPNRMPTGPIADPEGGQSPNPPNERRTGSRTL